MIEKNLKRRSYIAEPKTKNSEEQPLSPEIMESIQIKNNLIMDLEKTVENLRQAINKAENLVNKIDALGSSK